MPPVACWVQALGEAPRIPGLSLLVPEALPGVSSVVLTHHLVRRACGTVVLCREWRWSEGRRGYLPTALILTATWEGFFLDQCPVIWCWLVPRCPPGCWSASSA